VPSILQYDAAGVPARFLRDAVEQARYPTPPAGGGSLGIDEEDNAALAADVAAWVGMPGSPYTVSGGALQKNAAPVTVAPASAQTLQAAGSFAGAVRVQADRSTTSNAYQTIPDLQFQLAANSHYLFYFDGAYTAAAGTTGLQLAVTGPASPAFLGVGFEVATGATAWAVVFAAAYDTGANPTASGGAALLPFHVYGTVSTGAAGGVLALRGRSSVNGSAVMIKRGSFGWLSRVR
jgi:hypothetical protein